MQATSRSTRVQRRRLATRTSLAVVCLLGLAAGACRQEGSPAGSRNIVFVSSDTMRADRLGVFGHRPTSPWIDRLARQGVLFRRAFAQRSQTWPSLTSVLTSKHPLTHGVRTNGMLLDATHETLPEYLQAQGYATAAFLGNMSKAAHRGYDEFFSNEGERGNTAVRDRELADRAVAWLRDRRGDDPFFLWLHLMNPHGPYDPPDGYRERFHDAPYGRFTGARPDLERIALEKHELTREDLEPMLAAYDGEVLATDQCVGVLLSALDELGLSEDTVVVFFSDHGDELYQRNYYFMHSCSVYDSVLHVPLVVRAPGRLPQDVVVDDIVELIDITPTALTLAGLETPEWAQGQDLVFVVFGAEARGRAVSEWHPPMEPTDKALDLIAGKTPAEVKRLLDEMGLDRDDIPKGEVRDGLGMRFDPERSPIYVVRTEEYRFVMNHGEETPNDGVFNWNPGTGFPIDREELYDHRTDPGERFNRLAELPDAARRQREFLSEWIEVMERTAGRASFPTDPDTLEKLAELGYLELPGGSSGDRSKR